MTSIWTFSDLHQELAENAWEPQSRAPASVDVVVVAGDINVPLWQSLMWLQARFCGRRVIYVPGNHDYWRPETERNSYQDYVAEGRDRADLYGIDLLVEGESVVIDGTRFIGATLWTDHAVRPGWMPLTGAMAESRRRMNDYHRIRWNGNQSKYRLEPADTVWLHRQTRARIADALAQPFDGPTVVVTHHAPHPKSLGCPADKFDLPWAYTSDLTPVIEAGRPDLWIHGHLHGRADYVVGDTRIVMNSRGHAFEPSCRAFNPSFVVEVEARELVPAAGM